MAKTRAFDNIEEQDVKKMLTCFQANTLHYKKDGTILSNVANSTQVGIVIQGKANIIRYNFNGTRTIIETLKEGDAFGNFLVSDSEDLYIIASEESEIVMFDYDHLIKRCKKNCEYHNVLINNMFQIVSQKLKKKNERIEILTEKTIRDKLLAYFELLSKRQGSKVITLPYTLTDLADYLSIDRSAMMREIKKLNEERFIESKGRKIRLINY